MKRLFALALCIALASACTAVQQRCVGVEDNAKTHYVQGMSALEDMKLDVAREKFERANYCDFEKFSPGYGGLAIVYAYKAAAQSDPKFASVESERALANLKAAEDKAESKEDKFEYGIAGIRVSTILKGKDWIDKAEGFYDDIRKLEVNENKLDYYQGKEAAAFFMGEAYLAAREFGKARDMYTRVLDAKKSGKWNEKADRGFKRVDKIARATAGISLGDIGKKIALMDKVSRGALTALMVSEFKIDKVLAGRIPVQAQLAAMKAEFTPADVLTNIYKDDVLTLMKFNVRGLEPIYDPTTKAYLFKIEEPVIRKELAFTLEDILVKLTGDEKLPTAFFGNDKSPYPDVSPRAPWYNAVMNAVTRQLMETELSGEFRPDAPVDGAEAILAVRMLKQRVNTY